MSVGMGRSRTLLVGALSLAFLVGAEAALAACASDGECDDANACTAEHCANAQCVRQSINCFDDDPCTLDGCDSLEGCFHRIPSEGEYLLCRYGASDAFLLAKQLLRTDGVSRRRRLVRLLEHARRILGLPHCTLVACPPPKPAAIRRACEDIGTFRRIVAARVPRDIDVGLAGQLFALVPRCGPGTVPWQ